MINREVDANGVESVSGYISKDSYKVFVAVCLELSDIAPDEVPEESPKFKTEKDRLFYEDFMKKKAKHKKKNKSDPNFELSNMISVICTYHPSLNYSNIWDLTLAQVRDTFSQLLKARQLSIGEMNYAVWGGKFDPSLWYKRTDRED